MRARKKPVEIEFKKTDAVEELYDAYKWVLDNTDGGFEPLEVIYGHKPYPPSGASIDPRDGRMVISTLEGLHWVDPGDIIIQGVNGEFYPCKPDIFAKTYDIIDLSDESVT